MRRHIIGFFEFLVKESDVSVTDLFADGFDRGVCILQQDAGVVEAQFLDQRDIVFSGLALDESAQITRIELESIRNLLQAAVLHAEINQAEDLYGLQRRISVFERDGQSGSGECQPKPEQGLQKLLPGQLRR